MAKDKKLAEKIDQLKSLEHAVKKLRNELGYSEPGEVLWKAENWDTIVIVEADGYGGATVMEVDGNWPIDFLTKREKKCETQEEACRLANVWCGYENAKDGDEEPEEKEDDDDAKSDS